MKSKILTFVNWNKTVGVNEQPPFSQGLEDRGGDFASRVGYSTTWLIKSGGGSSYSLCLERLIRINFELTMCFSLFSFA